MLQDAEGFTELLFAIERVGSLVSKKLGSLDTYEASLRAIASNSPLSEAVPLAHPELHRPMDRLYPLVQRARNDALHQGAYARHLASHAVELAIILEDSLMADARLVGDFMVTSPVCAQTWQPLSYARQQMLEHSYSYLPIQIEQGWRLLSDAAVARVVRGARDYDDRKKRLTATILETTVSYGLELVVPRVATFTDPVTEFLTSGDPLPVLIVGANRELLGLVTPFDLL